MDACNGAAPDPGGVFVRTTENAGTGTAAPAPRGACLTLAAENTLHCGIQGSSMAKPNYQYEKRQRDIANKKKQDEKRARKQAKNEPAPTDGGAAEGGATDPAAANAG
jgi:hypothetical protein